MLFFCFLYSRGKNAKFRGTAKCKITYYLISRQNFGISRLILERRSKFAVDFWDFAEIFKISRPTVKDCVIDNSFTVQHNINSGQFQTYLFNKMKSKRNKVSFNLIYCWPVPTLSNINILYLDPSA